MIARLLGSDCGALTCCRCHATSEIWQQLVLVKRVAMSRGLSCCGGPLSGVSLLRVNDVCSTTSGNHTCAGMDEDNNVWSRVHEFVE